MNKEELDKILNHCLNDAFKVQKLRSHPNSNNIAQFVIEWLNGEESPIEYVVKSVCLHKWKETNSGYLAHCTKCGVGAP